MTTFCSAAEAVQMGGWDGGQLGISDSGGAAAVLVFGGTGGGGITSQDGLGESTSIAELASSWSIMKFLATPAVRTGGVDISIEMQAGVPKSRALPFAVLSDAERLLGFEWVSCLTLLIPISEVLATLLDGCLRLRVSLDEPVSLRILPSIRSEIPFSILRNWSGSRTGSVSTFTEVEGRDSLLRRSFAETFQLEAPFIRFEMDVVEDVVSDVTTLLESDEVIDEHADGDGEVDASRED